MKDVVFVNIRNDEGKLYDSYREEYYELVKLSGFQTIELGEIEYDRDYYVVVSPRNGNTEANFNHEQAKGRKCKLVLWLLEWSTWSKGQLQGASLEPYWDEVWVSDKYYQQLLQRHNPNATVKYVFLGGHPDFGGEPLRDKKWDFCLLAYLYGTRAHKAQILVDNGYSIAPNGWGETKRYTLSKCHWGLCMHQFGVPFLNSQRLTLFASWKLPIICDYVKAPYPYQLFPEGLIHMDPRNTICGDEETMKRAVDYNFHLVTTRTFRKEVEDCVAGVVSN